MVVDTEVLTYRIRITVRNEVISFRTMTISESIVSLSALRNVFTTYPEYDHGEIKGIFAYTES
jgi:hypothetical protein